MEVEEKKVLTSDTQNHEDYTLLFERTLDSEERLILEMREQTNFLIFFLLLVGLSEDSGTEDC